MAARQEPLRWDTARHCCPGHKVNADSSYLSGVRPLWWEGSLVAGSQSNTGSSQRSHSGQFIQRVLCWTGYPEHVSTFGGMHLCSLYTSVELWPLARLPDTAAYVLRVREGTLLPENLLTCTCPMRTQYARQAWKQMTFCSRGSRWPKPAGGCHVGPKSKCCQLTWFFFQEARKKEFFEWKVPNFYVISYSRRMF